MDPMGNGKYASDIWESWASTLTKVHPIAPNLAIFRAVIRTGQIQGSRGEKVYVWFGLPGGEAQQKQKLHLMYLYTRIEKNK